MRAHGGATGTRPGKVPAAANVRAAAQQNTPRLVREKRRAIDDERRKVPRREAAAA
jgi:hypothetical protein